MNYIRLADHLDLDHCTFGFGCSACLSSNLPNFSGFWWDMDWTRFGDPLGPVRCTFDFARSAHLSSNLPNFSGFWWDMDWTRFGDHLGLARCRFGFAHIARLWSNLPRSFGVWWTVHHNHVGNSEKRKGPTLSRGRRSLARVGPGVPFAVEYVIEQNLHVVNSKVPAFSYPKFKNHISRGRSSLPVHQCPRLFSDSQPDTLISKGAGKEGGFRHARKILWSINCSEVRRGNGRIRAWTFLTIERFRGHGFDVHDLGSFNLSVRH